MALLSDDAMERLLDGCQIIGAAADAAGAPSWEVYAEQASGLEVDLENDQLKLASGGGDGGWGIRIVDDGRFGYAYLGSTKASEVEAAVQQAVRIAALSPRVEGFALPDHAPATSVGGLYDRRLQDIAPDELLELGRQLVDSAKDADVRAVVTGGGVGVGLGADALVTSSGIEDSGIEGTMSAGLAVLIDEHDRPTSGWRGESGRAPITEVGHIAAPAVEIAASTRAVLDAAPDTGEAPVLLTDDGFSSLFGVMVIPALIGERLARGESMWSGKVGQQVITNGLSLRDVRTLEGGLSSGGRDGEGSPGQDRLLIDAGVLSGGLWTSRDAAEHPDHADGTTGSANHGGGMGGGGGHSSPPRPGPSNLQLTSRAGVGPRDSLIEELDQGWLIHSVMGAHTANPTSGDFSVTSSSILHIQDGEIVGALKQAGVSGNLPQSLSGEVRLGDTPRPRGGGGGSIYLPDTLLMSGIRVNPA